MKHIAIATLMLNLGIVYAQQRPVTMTFSGNGAVASPINLQYANTTTIEENVAGNGALGPFTFRNVTAEANSPSSQPPSTCAGATHLYFPRVAGAGILRFEDGSLLNVKLTEGADCIDLVANEGHCTLTLQVTGGTGRFQNASGVLTYTETARPVLADYFNNPVFFDEAGNITGTISGVAIEEESHVAR
ncbi:MAG: hypothetical protein JO336_14360 [Acidobacteriia bacterium]|nr:hypothetical protein [Terriglobia bacterium]